MTDRRQVAVCLDPDEDADEIQLFAYEADGTHTKIKSPVVEPEGPDLMDKIPCLIKHFLETHLPYIKYQEVDPFEMLDPDVNVTHTRIFNYRDVMLERYQNVSESVGVKDRPTENIELIADHVFRPSLPKLIYEEYPLFKPDVESSMEYTNEEYTAKFFKKFNKVLHKKFANLKKSKIGKDDLKMDQILAFQEDFIFKVPVPYESYFNLDPAEFYNVFQTAILRWIYYIFNTLIYPSTDELRQFFHKEEEVDDTYHPALNKDACKTLKSIGSVGESPYAFGIIDEDTDMLNKLLVHVEIVNIAHGVNEGYELYFNSQKKNFTGDLFKITSGADSTKIGNFLKTFTKCVAICLNSKTNRFIITDYYWCAVFEIEDVLEGDIEDVKKLISKVKVRHFGFSNFETDENLTIRNIISSFFFMKPSEFLQESSKIELLNKKVVDEWTNFRHTTSTNWLSSQKPVKKKFKASPFIYRTETGLSYTKQIVDLDASLIRFIAIGYDWSCQTLSVDLKKLYLDSSHRSKILNSTRHSKKGGDHFLLSVYDEYYQDPTVSMTSRHLKDTNIPWGNARLLNIAKQTYKRWLSNIEAYNKARSLQGDCIARIVDYGYLEDKPYNGKYLHFKTDGFYVVYEPIGSDYLNDLKPIDVRDNQHYELAKASVNKLHEAGVSFSPHAVISPEILKIYNDKIYIINLEDCHTMATQTNFKKDMWQLDKLFNIKRSPDPATHRRHSKSSRRSSSNVRSHELLQSLLRAMNNRQGDDSGAFYEGSSEDEEIY